MSAVWTVEGKTFCSYFIRAKTVGRVDSREDQENAPVGFFNGRFTHLFKSNPKQSPGIHCVASYPAMAGIRGGSA